MKIRGYRVEPVEIENRFNAHPSVASSAVIARRDPSGQASLLAFFIGEKGRPDPFVGRALLALWPSRCRSI